MPFSKENRISTINGILFVALFGVASLLLSEIPFIKNLSLSPLVIAIALGILFGNTFRYKLPVKWVLGLHFTTKHILRLGIILYGFRITFQEVLEVGAPGFFLDCFTILTTFLLSIYLGKKILKLDQDTSMLIGAGAAICGAAAVLATEKVLKSDPFKAATAVATVVLFGTISIFLYPLLYPHFQNLTDAQFGLYIGGTVHEVAQVIAIGNSISPAAESSAIIVKMTRVMLLAPFLTILGIFIGKKQGSKRRDVIPWFAFGFILVSAFNSFNLLPTQTIFHINQFDTFLLAMAMSAIGMETHLKKILQAGLKPLYMAALLYIWLIGSGALLINWIK